MQNKKDKSCRLVETTSRTLNNIYILDEIGKISCFLVKEDEIFLWNNRMGHMHFDNLVKSNKKKAVRDMQEISKLVRTICKHCQHGKKIRVE